MKLKLFKISLLFIIVLTMCSCSSKVKKKSIVIKESAYKIVIASDQSDYKDAIRGMLVEKYKKNITWVGYIYNILLLQGINKGASSDTEPVIKEQQKAISWLLKQE